MVTVTVYPANGKVTGWVRSNPADPNSGVEGVTITLQQLSALPGRPAGEIDTATTSGITGEYTIDNIYYGPSGGAFKLTPSKTNHTFDPSQYSSFTINSANPVTRNFTDNSTFTIKGLVYQQFEGQNCVLPGVRMILEKNGAPTGTPVYTNASNGSNYTLTAGLGNYTVRPSDLEKSFVPLSTEVSVNGNKTGINFVENTTYEVSGLIRAGCNTDMGVVTVKVTDGCIAKEVTTDGSGFYRFANLPAFRTYTLEVIDLAPADTRFNKDAVLEFFDVRTIELTDDVSGMDFTYHLPPEVEVLGLPEPSCAGYGHPVLEQGVSYPITIKVWEQGKTCPLSVGTIKIIDQIGDLESDTISFDFTEPETVYELKAGNPNIIYPHLKELTILVQDTFGNRVGSPVIVELDALVTGARPRKQNFTTESPELPLLILRDPPGDGSYSYWEQEQTMEYATRIFGSQTDVNNKWGSVRIGSKIGIEIFGVSTETSHWGDNTGTHEVTSYNSSGTETILSFTSNSRLETSHAPDFIGRDGDVFVASALTFAYAIADEVAFDPNTCSAVTSKSLILAKDGLETTVYYTEKDIRKTIIPNLKTVRDQSSDLAFRRSKDNQISVWEQTLQMNEDLKTQAVPIDTVAFSGGLTIEESRTNSSTRTSTIEFGMEINNEIATELGFEIAGSGISGGMVTNFKMENGEARDTTVSKSLTTGYALTDDDAGDQFRVIIKRDPVYQTPVFDLLGGQSSCPAEEGTNEREAMQLRVDGAIQAGIPADGTASFTFYAGNISESADTFPVNDNKIYFRVKDGSNLLYNATVIVNGTEYSDPVPLGAILPEDEVPITVGIQRGSSAFYALEGLEFEIYSDCNEELRSSATVSAYFQNPCSDITLVEPEDGWVINQADNHQIVLRLKDYDRNALDQVTIQYAPVGSSNFAAGTVLEAADLAESPFGTEVVWNVSTLPDGLYNLRLRVACAGGTNFSRRVTGRIDRTAPLVFGLPKPIDDNYQSSDEISASFTEVLDPAAFSAGSVILTRTLSGETVPASLAVFGNKVIITPSIDLSSLSGEPIEAVLMDMADLYGNTQLEPVVWSFTAGGAPVSQDFDGDGVIDAVDRCQGFDDNLDADNDGIPDACDLCPDQPSTALDFDGSNDYLYTDAIDGFALGNTPHTLEAWIYVEELPANRSWPLVLGGANVLSHHWLILSDGRMQVGAWSGGQMQPRPIAQVGKWVHYATAFDGDSLAVYVNGIEGGKVAASFNFQNSSLHLGKVLYGPERYFKGRMDEVRVWNRARSQSEIAATMYSELAGTESGLLLYYNMNEGTPEGDNTSISTVIDRSATGNDGSLYNFARTGASSNWAYGPAVNHADSNNNGIGDACEPDTDGDGIPDYADVCPLGDDRADADGDGVPDACDACAETANAGLDFDGADDHITFNSPTNIPVGNSAYTIEATFFAHSMGYKGIVGWGQYGRTDRVNALRLSHNGFRHYWWDNDLDATTGDIAGEWHHVAATFDGVQRRLYLDGQLIAEDIPGNGHNVPNADNLAIGKAFDNEYFDGIIDEVRLWNMARTQGQLAADMQQELKGNESGLIAYFKLNEGLPGQDNSSVDTIIDWTGANYGIPQRFAKTGNASNWVIGGAINCCDSCGEEAMEPGEGSLPRIAQVENKRIVHKQVAEAMDMDAPLVADTPELGSAPRMRQPLELQLQPNPARYETTVVFTVPEDGTANLDVYSLTGRHFRCLLDNQPVFRGQQEAALNTGDFPNGMYLVVLRTSKQTITKKLSVVKN